MAKWNQNEIKIQIMCVCVCLCGRKRQAIFFLFLLIKISKDFRSMGVINIEMFGLFLLLLKKMNIYSQCFSFNICIQLLCEPLLVWIFSCMYAFVVCDYQKKKLKASEDNDYNYNEHEDDEEEALNITYHSFLNSTQNTQ